MTYHKTKTGHVELVGSWRDGQLPVPTRGVACLTVSHDQTNAVWTFTGKRRDAAETIARLCIVYQERIATLYGSHIEVESVPDGFWIGKGEPDDNGEFDEFEPDTVRYPDALAW